MLKEHVYNFKLISYYFLIRRVSLVKFTKAEISKHFNPILAVWNYNRKHSRS